MRTRQTLSHALFRCEWVLLSLALPLGLACGGDRIVSVDAGSASKRIEAHVGDRVDIHLWAGAGGLYESSPTISTSAVQFIDESIEIGTGGFVSPGGPGQLFRFRAISRGTALVTFSPVQDAPVVVDTINVQ